MSTLGTAIWPPRLVVKGLPASKRRQDPFLHRYSIALDAVKLTVTERALLAVRGRRPNWKKPLLGCPVFLTRLCLRNFVVSPNRLWISSVPGGTRYKASFD